jgi:glycosyltransferase involved in cell wall biosynthesis
MRPDPVVVVGIPAYNEERNIGKVIVQAQKYAGAIIVCDDGSSDMTGDIATGLGAFVVRHERNLGYGAAIQSLFKEAKKLGADVLVTLDADGQHDAEGVPQLIQPILDGEADLVTGSRFLSGEDASRRNGLPWHRRWGIKAITKLTASVSERWMTDAQNGFRAYSKTAMDTLCLSEKGMGVSVEALVRAKEQGLRIMEVPVDCLYAGVEQPSSHNPIRHGVSVVSSLIKLIVEDRPLVLLGIPGILFLTIGIAFGLWLLQIYAATHQIITNIALAAMGFLVIGFFALSTAITLYAISRLAAKTNNKYDA